MSKETKIWKGDSNSKVYKPGKRVKSIPAPFEITEEDELHA